MNNLNFQPHRLLGIAFFTRGFGFAVLEGEKMLIDWGVKIVTHDPHRRLSKITALIALWQPDAIVLDDAIVSRRNVQIQKLTTRIITLANHQDLKVILFSRKQVRQVFFFDEQGTKHALAELLANRFPVELGPRLPPKRKPWMSEHYNMNIFDAAALTLAGLLSGHKQKA